MRQTKYFLVKEKIAERADVINERYHTEDGLMVLGEQDMGRVRLEPEEYLTGVVEQVVSEEEAVKLIDAAGRKLGPLVVEQAEDNPADEVGIPDDEVGINEEETKDFSSETEDSADKTEDNQTEAEEGLTDE